MCSAAEDAAIYVRENDARPFACTVSSARPLRVLSATPALWACSQLPRGVLEPLVTSKFTHEPANMLSHPRACPSPSRYLSCLQPTLPAAHTTGRPHCGS
uniref:Uncharacterized protein n=1 Tax=Chlamydomonas euryale TaxID=1486919 RepID=A0A7R9YSU7_9CHLO